MDDIVHPYQGHVMQAAFEGFCAWAIGHAPALDAFKAAHPQFVSDDFLMQLDPAEVAQAWVDFCLVAFGTPDQIGAM